MSIYKTPDTPTKTGKREGSQNYPTIVNTRLYLLRIRTPRFVSDLSHPSNPISGELITGAAPHDFGAHVQGTSMKSQNYEPQKGGKGSELWKRKGALLSGKDCKTYKLSGREGA